MMLFRDIYAYVWKRMVEEKTPHRAILLANNDYKVIIVIYLFVILN